MDLETENRIASVLLREAAELRRQAQHDGVLAYLRQPTVRGRPNSRFLTATVRGIQQINKAVEVDEMWRVRQKELELEDRLKGRSRDYDKQHSSRGGNGESTRSQSKRYDTNTLCSSSKRSYEDYSNEGEGLKDEEIEAFLHSRVKRGRGSVGSRMDEPGPYLSRSSESLDVMASDHIKVERDSRVIVGPEKPSYWKRRESSDDDSEEKRSKKNSSSSRGSKKKHSKKHKSKEKSRDKKKKRKHKRHSSD